MPNYRDYRSSYAAGVVSEEFLSQPRDALTGQALLTGENVFLTNAGTLKRRPGSDRIYSTSQTGRVYEFALPNGEVAHILFFNNGFRVDTDEGGLITAQFDCPWTLDDVFTMSIVDDENSIVIVDKAFHPHQITVDGNNWTHGQFQFYSDPTGRKYSPFIGADYLGHIGVTMSVSAYSGSVTVTFSGPVLLPEHVGVHFMYMRSQIRIDSVISPTQAQATVIDRLYPTIRITVQNGSAYRPGDIVEGDTTNVRGLVIGVFGNNLDVVLRSGYSLPFIDGDTQQGELLIADEASEIITSIITLPTPGTINIWFEELISTARGFPRCACLHRTRLVLSGFENVQGVLAASAVNQIGNFDLGSGSDSDAILERVGTEQNSIIKHVISTEQLIILTDRSVIYVPENGTQKFATSTIGFDLSTPDGVSDVPPVWAPEGIIFVDNQSRVLLLALTGTPRGVYTPTELSLLAHHLINDPKQLVFSSGLDTRPERVVGVLNSDGTIAAMVYRRGSEQVGWVRWSRGEGSSFQSLSSLNGELYCLSDEGPMRYFERFNFQAVLDGEFSPDLEDYPDIPVHGLLNGHVVLEGRTAATGPFVDPNGYESMDRLGRDFTVLVEPAWMVIGQAGRQRRRAARTWVDTINTGLFYLNDTLCAFYPHGSDLESQPGIVDREYKASQLGTSINRTIKIEQREGEGAPLHVRSHTSRIYAV